MKCLFSLRDNNKFSQISGDNNKIHLDYNFTKKLFVKFPIVHGVHIVIYALSKFFKKNKNFYFVINYLNIKFNNYLNINENFKIKLSKKKILVKTDSLIIAEIEIGFSKFELRNEKFNNLNNTFFKKFYFKNLKNKSIINELLVLSQFVGTKNPGHGSLILNFKISLKKNNRITTVKRKVTNRLFNFIFTNKSYFSNLVVSKPKKIDFNYKNFLPKKNLLKKLNGKRVLIFGSTGALGSYTKYYFSKYPVKIYLANRSASKEKKIEYKNFKINISIENNLEKLISIVKPDLVLYFLSPKIRKSYKKNFDLQLFKIFQFYYYGYFKKIINNLKKLNKKIIVFYPSSSALNKNFDCSDFPKEYIRAKKKAEMEFFNKNFNNVSTKFYRIDKMKSLQNYNITGFYEGKPADKLKSFLDNFINKY